MAQEETSAGILRQEETDTPCTWLLYIQYIRWTEAQDRMEQRRMQVHLFILAGQGTRAEGGALTERSTVT